MYESDTASTPSADFLELQSLFNSLEKPYGPGEVVRFNLAYIRAHPHLKSHEKYRAAEFLDALVAEVEHEDCVCCPSDS
ncbi:MAG: hypothetical protein MUF20_13000 [Methylotetracoccus sp.]|jgi:hypothetical protein|nr:hypothetical protein [Methylotetracoccus sp.]